MSIDKTAGKLTTLVVQEGKLDYIAAGKISMQDSKKGSAPENLVLPEPTHTPPKPKVEKSEKK